MDFPLFDFVVASLLMGLGIGADVAIATYARASQLQQFRVAVLWVIGVSLTHTLFPMAGYLMTYFSIQLQPGITPVIGVIAFSCILYFLSAELKDYGEESAHKDDTQLLVTLGLILAVSWDALWSGPAKSAQVIGWPELLVWASFVIVGGVVSILAITSLTFAKRMNQKAKLANETYSTREVLGHWLQYSVIAYFGLLAIFRYTLSVNLYWWQILLIAGCAIALVMSVKLQQRVHAVN